MSDYTPGGEPTYDRVAHLYDQTRGWPREVERVIGAGLYYLISSCTGRDEPAVLEIGIGTGRVAVPLAAHGACVYGIDVSPGMLAVMNEKSEGLVRAGFPQRVAAGLADAQNLPFADNSFDAGLVVHVLHRLPDWQRGLSELLRVTKLGGVILLGVDEGSEDDAAWVADRWPQIVEEEGGELKLTPQERVGITYDAAQVLAERYYAIEEHTLARWLTTRTAGDVVRPFRERWFSGTLSLSDDVLERCTARLEAELLSHFGSLEAELESDQRFKIILARPPGASTGR